MVDVLPAVESEYEYIGNNLALDFANTMNWHGSEQPTELVHSYTDLAQWGREAGIVTGEETAALLAEAERRPADAARILDEARRLRAAIYLIFENVIEDAPSGAATLAVLNTALSKALPHLCLTGTGQGFDWTWHAAAADLDRLLWPVARSAADLLVSADLARVRTCSADTCGWLFVDTSRNGSRRWCSMEVCGNRAKARRHYDHERRPRQTGA
jgi:predicted RNA-binding Zn ribbon-like protein